VHPIIQHNDTAGVPRAAVTQHNGRALPTPEGDGSIHPRPQRGTSAKLRITVATGRQAGEAAEPRSSEAAKRSRGGAAASPLGGLAKQAQRVAPAAAAAELQNGGAPKPASSEAARQLRRRNGAAAAPGPTVADDGDSIVAWGGSSTRSGRGTKPAAR
jgi:hypothetical protein